MLLGVYLLSLSFLHGFTYQKRGWLLYVWSADFCAMPQFYKAQTNDMSWCWWSERIFCLESIHWWHFVASFGGLVGFLIASLSFPGLVVIYFSSVNTWPSVQLASDYRDTALLCSALFAWTGTPTVRAATERHQLYCSIYDPQVKTDYFWLDHWWRVWPTICCNIIAVSLGNGFHGNKPRAPLICCFAALAHLEAGWIPFCQAHILLLYFLTELSLSRSCFLSPSLSLSLCLFSPHPLLPELPPLCLSCSLTLVHSSVRLWNSSERSAVGSLWTWQQWSYDTRFHLEHLMTRALNRKIK